MTAHAVRRERVGLAVEAGLVVRDRRGRYALPGADEAIRAAHRLAGVLTGPSAAVAHGWETTHRPGLPTVIDCARTMPFDEASALAANPFESVLRAISLDLPGLSLRPQVEIRDRGWCGRPDLVDERLGLVVEAESFEFHGRRATLRRDCERYSALVLLGWSVVRFAWEHVMFDAAYVSTSLRQAVLRAQRQVTLAELPGFRA